MDINTKIFFKINNLQGKSVLLDAFGRAGAEFVIVAMFGWYAGSAYLFKAPVFWPLYFLFCAWVLELGVSVILGEIVQERRPHVTYANAKTLFNPLSGWKSFPSDHTGAAFLIYFCAVYFSLPGAWALLVMALWVVWGRVYAGMHYPLDILGGLTLAYFAFTITRYLL